jgi:hypothetical protein
MTNFRIEKLRREHPIDTFSCGREELDRFLVRYAFGNQQANVSQTYLGLHGTEVIGFYSLKDAMQRTLQAADIGGIRAFAVHAKDAPARQFCERFGFIPSAKDPLHIFRLIKDLRRSLEE